MTSNLYELFSDALLHLPSAIDSLVRSKEHNESHLGRNVTIADAAASGDFRILQPIWDIRLGRENFFASPLFPVILSVSFYFSFCTPFMIADLLGDKLPCIHKYKIQSNLEVTWAQIWDTVSLTFWNHVLYILPAAVSQWVWTPDTYLPERAPTLFEFLWHQVAALVIFDLQYFVWHWTHHKVRFLYKHVHALHHRYHSPFVWTTQYLHPWELITVGFLTTTNTWFFNCHPLTIWSYMVVSIIVSVEAHIGFDFPFTLNHFSFGMIGGAPKHDMHHLKPLTNFQPFFNHWDKIFGSYCPVMTRGGVKPPDLLDYERKQKETKKTFD
ncbi:cholesterol 25-hydroxylase-like protein 1, member 2 [Mya arenaria]|uniref:cholesterol 25-hydroxylase-like protein 1, member 2 n=1 Tax=Mya arenaria TaxID=6604 RepID=UPI0022E15A1B|nr:cholesterol 25-hydroxylase-like protein 1, member 2 [Mya arenaria]